MKFIVMVFLFRFVIDLVSKAIKKKPGPERELKD